ncbi:adenosine 3'-phospho 5'-phosphosulfate transporter 1-like isoform X2 [Mizuhopecten yessoensis]|uniref:Adenosine 3'-phospho 5'-phosphosulfate transporter 1 n=2 Tax=Mizuhopecten yessoensis TaxID=6573 RepID=A0A210PJ70_MIZYE|nr:adenosine 3'-phospho 5'-phosphosulfate transporter 1-like isoform X2 [Mizuhopecten yessoensis]OWF36542.1 Adenosine 3'-phospho 5'-phosphosulfate transporter 1 [Mizuhopecten yessoensis]
MQATMWFFGILVLNIVLPLCLGKESTAADNALESHWVDFWMVRLCLNILGYATLFVPGALLIKYFRDKRYNETAGPDLLSQIIKNCVFGRETEKGVLEQGGSSKTGGSSDDNVGQYQKCGTLLFCVAGLQGAYLTWGVLQERIMTFEYGKTDTEAGEFFKNSQFLVFINRILALVIGGVVLVMRAQPPHNAPLFKYSYSSFSNIMSSWFQYEALKFVSFPTQVLAKASKVIPVMLMGKVVSRKTYEYNEYVTALMISFGISMFLLSSGDVTRHKGSVTTVSGVILLAGYILFDSFTSNWQGELFRRYKMSPIQMMTGVNLFSCLLTAVSLLEQGGFFDSVAFMGRNPAFIFHAMILSLCSAFGQLFIFFTLSRFGPVTFTIIMTIRQGIAILLSCVIYGHPVTYIGFFGIMVVFLALFLKIYAGHRKKQIQNATQQSSNGVSKV